MPNFINPYNLPTEFFEITGIPEWMWAVGTENQGFDQRSALFANYLAQNPQTAQMFLQRAADMGLNSGMDYAGAQNHIRTVLGGNLGVSGTTGFLRPNFKNSSYNPFSAGAGTVPSPNVAPVTPSGAAKQKKRVSSNPGVQTPAQPNTVASNPGVQTPAQPNTVASNPGVQTPGNNPPQAAGPTTPPQPVGIGMNPPGLGSLPRRRLFSGF